MQSRKHKVSLHDPRNLFLVDLCQDEVPSVSTFRIPQFGSVVIPAYPSGNGTLATPHIRAAFRIFAEDLLELLGVPPIPASLLRESSHTTVPNAWQIAALLRTQIRATTTETKETLTSISRLVARIQEMRVGKDVVNDVELAVRLLEEAFDASTRQLTDVWTRTKRASALADRAFFNPNMVGLLYFVSPCASAFTTLMQVGG
jgi:phosphatidylinositol glycan class S